jgi:phosphate starvation-inducible membrane PsiE
MKAQQLNHIAFGTLASAKFIGITSLVLLFMKHHTMAGTCLFLYGILIMCTLILTFKAMKLHNQEPYEEDCF